MSPCTFPKNLIYTQSKGWIEFGVVSFDNMVWICERTLRSYYDHFVFFAVFNDLCFGNPLYGMEGVSSCYRRCHRLILNFLFQIWSCIKCFSFFHLECIKRWAKDSIVHQKRIQEDQNPNAVKEYYNWCCPKCREEYSPEKIPTQYLCFCLKTVDPKYDLYLPPHSCGETCGKNLIPECGHKCVIPCHPGPCPPCPKTINSNCFCGTQKRLQRCSNKFWGCGGKCNKLLTCGRHPCNKKCHSEACLPCPQQSLQKCDCKSETKLRECASPNWKCNKVSCRT